MVSQIDGFATITGSTLGIIGSGVLPDGFVFVSESQCAGGLLIACAGGEFRTLTAFHPPDGNQFDSITYAQSVVFVDVFKDIGVTGVGGVSRIEQHFQQTSDAVIPEPATMLLFSTALLGLGFMRRKKS